MKEKLIVSVKDYSVCLLFKTLRRFKSGTIALILQAQQIVQDDARQAYIFKTLDETLMITLCEVVKMAQKTNERIN